MLQQIEYEGSVEDEIAKLNIAWKNGNPSVIRPQNLRRLSGKHQRRLSGKILRNGLNFGKCSNV